MKRLAWIAGGAVLLVLLAAATVPFLIPNEVYRSQIERTATNALGRDVALDGEVGLGLLPRLSARISGVRVANPDGFSREHMIEAGELRGIVKWAPLLAGRVELAELVFVDADVKLERLENGETNWTFGDPDAPATPPEEGGGSIEGGIDRASLRNARLVYTDAAAGMTYEISELDLSAQLPALSAPLIAEANGRFQGSPFDVELRLETPAALMADAPGDLDLTFELGGARAGYEGTLTLGEVPSLDGRFTLVASDLSALARLAEIESPIELSRLGRLQAAGQVSGAVSAARITFDRLSIGGEGLDARYAGAVTLGEALALGGTLDVDASALGDWLGGLGLELPPAAGVLERVDLTARLDGPVDALEITDLSFSQSGRLIDASFDGTVGLAGSGRIEGRLDASSDRLRDLLAALQIEMPPGEALDRFSLESTLAGSFQRLEATELDAALDETRLAGRAGLDLSGARPSVSGALTSGTLDLSPFLAAESDAQAAGGNEGWSEEPLDLAGLRAVDADLSLQADTLILGDVTLAAADLSAALDNGNLTAQIASMQAFGGAWRGAFGLDARGEQPELSLDLTGQPIEIGEALQTLAGLNALSGLGEIRVDVRSRGRSIKALVEGLAGEMGANLSQGALRGINVGQLVRSRQDILAALADGSLQLALAPQAETDFTNMIANLDLSDGVARISAFQLDNPVLSLSGSGEIDLGARMLDVSIVPELDTSGQAGGSALQLNGVPIPFRVSGDWLSPRLSPDTRMIQQTLAQDVTNRVRGELEDELGGEVGDLLEDLLDQGGNRAGTPPAEEDQSASEPAGAGEDEAAQDDSPAAPARRDPEQVLREEAQRAAREALGGLLGQREEEEPEAQPEPQQ